ncbi:MAG: response regulator [Nitrospirota bacterium]|nr:response regulator [Nitrospirota bacterium]
MTRVLVIEDNESNIYLIRFMLEKEGYEVLVARDGTSGVAMAIQEKPDLILMDLQLPDITGLEATKQIRTADPNGTIPIVAVTSYAMTGDLEKALAAGCTGYIEKPINPETFLQEIQIYL